MASPLAIFSRLAIPALLGAAAFAVGPIFIHEPLGIALWSVVGAIVLLPLVDQPVAQAFLPVSAVNHRQECLCHRYLAAAVPIVVGAGITAGFTPAILIAAVVWSLLGGVQLLAALRVPVRLAVALTMIGALLSFTWPIWMAGILETHDLGPWLQRAVNISPPFALNAVIAPTDPLTHRPLAYRLMNLGQDVSYTMPASVWACVALHAGMGLIGLVANEWSVRARKRIELRAPTVIQRSEATKDLG